MRVNREATDFSRHVDILGRYVNQVSTDIPTHTWSTRRPIVLTDTRPTDALGVHDPTRLR